MGKIRIEVRDIKEKSFDREINVGNDIQDYIHVLNLMWNETVQDVVSIKFYEKRFRYLNRKERMVVLDFVNNLKEQ